MSFVQGALHLCAPTWIWLRGWMFYVLPALSNLILVLLGVVLSLPTLAQKIEDTPKYRIALGVVCVLFGLVGFWFDVDQRRSSDLTNKQLLQDTGTALRKTSDLIDKTSGLVTGTNDMVSRLGLMAPQITAATDHLARIDQELNLAKKHNDTQQVTALEAQRAGALSTLRQMAAGILADLQFWANKWDVDDRALDSWHQHNRDRIRMANPDMTVGDLDLAATQDYLKRKTELNLLNTKQVLPVMTNANYLRQEMLQDVQQTDEDKKNAVIFAKVLAGEPIDWGQMAVVSGYMQVLTRKFLTPMPPTTLKLGTVQ